MKKYREIAKGNIKDSCLYYIVAKNETKLYLDLFKKRKDDGLARALEQFNDYDEKHSELIAKETVTKILQEKQLEDITTFHDQPRAGHFGLYTDLEVDKKLIPAELKEHKWNFLSLTLLMKNSALFNNLVSKYTPMVRSLLPFDPDYAQNHKGKFVSELHALVQQNDEKFTEAVLNNHQGMFVDEEVWAILKNGIQTNVKQASGLLKSHTVRSWFVFLSEEAKKDLVMEMFQWIGKNKINSGLLALELVKRPYSEVFDEALREEIEEMMEESAESQGEASEASEAESDEEDMNSESD